MAPEVRPTPFPPQSREVMAYQRRQRLARWSIVVNLATFLGVASSSVIIDVLDQSEMWSPWVVLVAAVIAAMYVAVIERHRVRARRLQRQFDRLNNRGRHDAR